MSGRIADLAVYEKNTAIWYVGTAHGGVWKTTSNGATFTPLMQDRGLMSIGDVAVSQSNPDIVWVGTGESNNRQTTSWGDGVFKSTDGGKTFENIGLRDSKHINRILIDPNNDDVVLVAATGSIFGPGGDRGVYKTTDGGKTWKRVLFVDDETGANDLVMSYTDPKTMYASTYQRRRTACCVNGGGPGSGIWKSIDGGDTWTRLTGGIPSGPLGRIGLDTYRKNGNIVYASIEAQGPAGGRGGRGGGGAAAVAVDAGDGAVRGAADAAAADVGESGLYRSDDGGQTWHKVGSNNPRPLYFSQVRVDPNNPDRVFQGGVKMSLTIDGGKTFETQASLVAHDDVHAIWIDPNNSDHMIIGDDGGLSQSYDGAKTWSFFANLPVGLFYHVGYDMAYPFNVCGGMQDNYDWCGPSASRFSGGILSHEWFQIQGGDGFVAIPDKKDSRWIYSETQDGNIIRRNKITGESKQIRPNAQNVTPAPKAGESFRWEWDTPMIISPNDPGSLIVAANRVFVSHDRGDSWTVISPDLTTNVSRDTIVTMGLKGSEIRISRDDGVSQWPAIVTLAESPKQAGPLLHGQRRRSVVRVARRRKELAEHHEEFAGHAGRRLDQQGGSVGVRCRHGVRDRRQPPAQRLQAIRLGEHGFRRNVPLAVGQSRERRRQDVHRRPAEPRRPLHRDGDGHSALARSRQELAAAQGQLADGARGRDDASLARQRDDRRDARPRAVGPRPSRADSGIHGRAERRRQAVHDSDGARVEDEGRPQRGVLGTSVLRRRESAERGGHSVFSQVADDGSRAARLRRRGQGRREP